MNFHFLCDAYCRTCKYYGPTLHARTKESANMNPRIFIGTMAVGYDYFLCLNMLGVFLVAVLLTLGCRSVNAV
jgi:hypothetical protein